LPDGSRGPGLFAYLRSLTGRNGADRRDVIATVFKGTINRMINGYLLRDVINKVSGIHFGSSEELHTLGALYETMLREMRDAAGDSGEFYTPRPVVRFMVAVTDPKLGETILDPACGTGGFLVEAFEHLEKQCKTVQDRQLLQKRSIFGGEAKPLPYLLAQMNLLLHGLESPQVNLGNSLSVRIAEIGEKDRVDIILTNPPFGGEEERGILANFPSDKQTAETALLFLQVIMRKIRRAPKSGRAAVVVPDGILSQEGVASRIREELVTKYNLHTVLRLPRGVFEPYSKIRSNILFFDTGPKTNFVWYYEVKMRAGIKAYTQHRQLEFEELKPCISWWTNREDNDCAWQVTNEDIAKAGYSLDFKNPRTAAGFRFRAPETLLVEAAATLEQLLSVKTKFASVVEGLRQSAYGREWESEEFGKLTQQVRREEKVISNRRYRLLGMSWYAKGLYVKTEKLGQEIKADKVYRVEKGDFVYNRLFAWKGSFAEAQDDTHGCYVSNEFPVFQVIDTRVVPGFLWSYFAQPILWDHIEGLSSGTTSTSRLRLKEARIRKFRIPLPPEPVQRQLLTMWFDSLRLEDQMHGLRTVLGEIAPGVFERTAPALIQPNSEALG